MKQYYASRRAQHILQVSVPVLALLLIGFMWYFLPFLYRWLLWALSILLGGAAAVVSVVILPLWFDSVSYVVSDTHIIKRSGFVFMREQIMRTDALQYWGAISSPAPEKTGLGFLPLHAYGGSMVLVFLNGRDMEEIQAFLRQKVYHSHDRGEDGQKEGGGSFAL